MTKYTESELIQLRTCAVVPTTYDFLEFIKQLEDQREIQPRLEEEEVLHPRRRSSHASSRPRFNLNRKPRVRHEAPQPDADGWVTLNKRKNSVGEDDEVEEQNEQFRETIKDQKVTKIKASSKKMAGSNSSGAADINEKPKTTFNAFAALDSEDEDETEDDE